MEHGFNDINDGYELLEELQPHMLGRVARVTGGDFVSLSSGKDGRGAGEDYSLGPYSRAFTAPRMSWVRLSPRAPKGSEK